MGDALRNEIEGRVCDAIAKRRKALQDDLRLHVETPTGGRHLPGLDRTREVLTSRLRRLGAAVDLIAGDPRPEWLFGSPGYGAAPAPTPEPLPTAVCRREVGADLERRPVLISGHLDTVHTPPPAGTFTRLTVAGDGRTAVGPGCVDMKGGLVIGLAALECLDEAGVRLPWTFVLNSDEETGSYHSQRAIQSEAARVAGAGGIGVALEPAGGGAKGELVVERAGSGQFFIEVTGRAAHVGRDFGSGISAVNLLAGIILRLAQSSQPERNIILNVGPIEGGNATNAVPDRARAWGNVRFPSPEMAAVLERDIRQIAEASLPAGGRVRVEFSFVRQAKPPTPETQRLAEICQLAGRVVNPERNIPLGKTAGVCDGNIMQAAGLPTLDTLGVRGGGLHTPEEWIELDTLVERCQLLAVFLLRASEQSSA